MLLSICAIRERSPLLGPRRCPHDQLSYCSILNQATFIENGTLAQILEPRMLRGHVHRTIFERALSIVDTAVVLGPCESPGVPVSIYSTKRCCIESSPVVLGMESILMAWNRRFHPCRFVQTGRDLMKSLSLSLARYPGASNAIEEERSSNALSSACAPHCYACWAGLGHRHNLFTRCGAPFHVSDSALARTTRPSSALHYGFRALQPLTRRYVVVAPQVCKSAARVMVVAEFDVPVCLQL
jgi:hypothetical protein